MPLIPDTKVDSAPSPADAMFALGATLDARGDGHNAWRPSARTDGAAAPAPCAAAEAGEFPRRFGDYELLGEIARGGMGVVYRARQRSLNRLVAVKMILGGRLASETEVRRFAIEAEAAAQLDHSGIVPIHEIGQVEGQHFFSMALIEGDSLAERLKQGPLPPREAATLLCEISHAVQYAHDHGVIHRDLKPQNVLLDRAGRPKVTDFGLAKQTAGDSNLTLTGQIMGTPSYMSPEQAAGSPVTAAADIYALGALLYSLLVGRPPFQAASSFATMQQVLHDNPVPPRRINSHVPVDLETICLKCVEKDPQRRYATAQVLADDLSAFLAGEPIKARPPTLTYLAGLWLRTHVRTAVGSLLAGLLTGVLAGSLVLAVGFPAAGVREGYRQFPTPMVCSGYIALLAEWQQPVHLGGIEFSTARLLILLLMLFGWSLAGLAVVLAARPEGRRHDVTAALIAGLVTGLTAYVGGVGWFTTWNAISPAVADIRLLGSIDAAHGGAAALLQYPELAGLPEEQRAASLAFKTLAELADRSFDGLWTGMILSMVLFGLSTAGQVLIAGPIWRQFQSAAGASSEILKEESVRSRGRFRMSPHGWDALLRYLDASLPYTWGVLLLAVGPAWVVLDSPNHNLLQEAGWMAAMLGLSAACFWMGLRPRPAVALKAAG